MDAIVLVSGGIDSAVALAWALDRDWEVRGLTFDYHERPDAERRALASQFDALGLEPPRRLALPFLREVEDLDDPAPGLADAPEGYVPARNAVFYSIAAHLAEAGGIPRIVGGHNGGDGDDFPDADAAYFDDLADLVNRGLHTGDAHPLTIQLPLKDVPKADVIRRGRDLGVPFEATWSCNYDGATHCGTCSSCTERRRAFAEADVPDPLDVHAPAEVTP